MFKSTMKNNYDAKKTKNKILKCSFYLTYNIKISINIQYRIMYRLDN